MTSPLIQSRLIRSGLLMPMFSPAVAAALTTVAFEDFATSTGQNITAPSSIQAGDVLFLSDVASSGTGVPTTVVPSGFTSVINTPDDFDRAILSYKIADGSESSSSITGMNGNDRNAKVLLQFRGNVPITMVSTASPNGQATGGDPTSQTITASGGTPPLVVLASYWSYAATVNPRTMSPAKDGEQNSSVSHYFAWKIYNASPVNVSADMDDEGDVNILQSFYAQFS